MKKYFKLTLILYFISLAAGLVCRTVARLWFIDAETGFYAATGNGAAGIPAGLSGIAFIAVFNCALVAVPLITLTTSRLRRADGDYPVYIKSKITNALAALTGLLIIAFSIQGPPRAALEQGRSETFTQISMYTCLALGVLAGIAFLYLGFGGVFGRDKTPAGVLVILPAVWMIIILITRFNDYTTITAISDHLLVVLFMLGSILFLVGHARTVCMQMRKDGRNYTIPTGLCASLFGFLLVIPNYVYMLVNRAPMPTPLLGEFESAYILAMSLYQLSFVIGLARCIKKV